MTANPEQRAADDAEYVEYVRARMGQFRRVAFLMCGDWDRGDDVVQRVLTELYRKWHRLRRADSVDAVVRTMLCRRLVDERRLGWGRVRTGAPVPDVPAPESDPVERLTLVVALRSLPPRQRAVLVLRYFQDLTVEDTAAALGCAPGTVKSQASKGLTALRRVLSPTDTII